MKYIDENDIDQIDTNLWLGNHNGANNIDLLNKNKIKIIINFYKIHPIKYDNIKYYHIPFKFNEISLENSQKLIKILKIIFDENKKVNILICCKAGHHRSANAVALYLINKYKWDYDKATNHIKSIRIHSLDRESKMSSAIQSYGNLINKLYT